MRLFTNFSLFLAIILFSICSGFSFEYDEEVKPSYISRRAIDGTRGRKYFNPQEDGFLDDYGFEKGQYHGIKEKFAFTNIRSNVPGEPGVDYPAYVNIPKTIFSCINRNRGYYADEDAGCQVFHVCDEGLSSSFLCPIGSLFSQRLLTCDWWSRVSCSESRKFYSQQRHSADVSLNGSDMLRQALSETKGYHRMQIVTNKKENVEKLMPIFINIKRNENQLENDNNIKSESFFQDYQHDMFQDARKSNSTTNKESKDSSIIRTKTSIDDKRRSKGQGYSRSTNYNPIQLKLTSQDNNLKYFSSTLPDLFKAIIVTDSPTSNENNVNLETTTMFSETFTKQYQHSIGINALNNLLTKRKLKQEIKDVKNRPNIRNSSYEYDEIEGKESIGLVNSHVERNLEKEEVTIKSVPNNAIQKKNKTMTLEFIKNATSVTNAQIKQMSQLKDNIQAKESFGLIHSKIRAKEKMKVTVNPQKDIEQRTRLIIDPVEKSVSDMSLVYPTEASTLLYSNTETSTGGTNFDSHFNAGNTHSSPISKSHEAHENTIFEISVMNNMTLDSKDLPSTAITSSDYQYVLNSTDTPFTTTNLPTTIRNFEQQRTVTPNYIKRITDAMQESNSPFEITFPLNSNSNLINNNYKSPIEVEILGRLITQDERYPVNFEDLEIVRSDQINQNRNINENQQQVIDSPSSLTTFQDFSSDQKEEANQQTIANYRFQSTTTRTLQTPKNHFNYQNQHNGNKNFQPYQIFPQSSKNQFYVSIPETQIPQQNFKNYQKEPRNFINKQVNNDEHNNFNNTKNLEFVYIPDKSNLTNKKDPDDFNNYKAEQKERINLETYPNQANSNHYYHDYHKRPDDIQNYRINYQPHHYPQYVEDNKQNYQKNYKYDNIENHNYQNTGIFENFKNYENTESNQNYKNQAKPLYFQSYKNNNYPAYKNYENSEALSESSHFEGFGNRIIMKNQNTNAFLEAQEKSKNIQAINEQIINSDLQGKSVNFLWTMSQLVENDRLPRPFIQDKKSFSQNIDNKDINYHSNIYDTYSKYINNFNNFNNYNNYNQVNLNRSNLNNAENVNYNKNLNVDYQQNLTTDQFKINVNDFANPKFETTNTDIKNQHLISFSNKKSESVNNKRPLFVLDNNQNLNEPSGENYSITRSITENPFPISPHSQSDVDLYLSQRSSRLNTYLLDKNQQFTQIPQPNFNEFVAEDNQPTRGNIRILNSPQSQLIDINYHQNTHSSIDKIRVPDNNIHKYPESNDFNFQQTTQQSIGINQWIEKNPKIMQEIQSQTFEYDLRPTTVPSEIKIESQDFQSDNQRFNITERTSTWKSTIETEFIPSLSFDFGSDEGMKEYLEALKKGLVTSDTDSMKINEEVSSSINTKMDIIEEVSRSKKSNQSKIINNFKDVGEILSKIE